STSSTFWDGLESQWKRMRPSKDHVCEPTYPIKKCGEVAAILTQVLNPCYKMTCGSCSAKINETTLSEHVCNIHTAATVGYYHMQEVAPEFTHVTKLLEVLIDLTDSKGDATPIFEKIHKMIGSKTQSPFTHLNQLNEFFLKGCENKGDDWIKARDSLLELSRFQKNRTDNISKGDIGSFRNKMSSKAHYNYYLSCDNQLDKNANFLWGQREYHAKRFFSDFFSVIDPELGYENWAIRKNPNGERKLSIGNLIVPLDLMEFRKKMCGEDTNQPLVGKQCVSMKDSNFLYPCCCVTRDDGSAVLSTFYAPTKKHLVIGTTGDQKYVDLPKGESESLYIAKDGYCYINLFLAMLINIREEDAKDFTKKVRDLIIPRLGKWPTLLDVATTCAQLRIFFPDIHDAELPRILVDHNTKTCHVVDSFGSISAGYHILKAATVAQLALFADDALDSEMKHYLVG
nr:HC-Pro [Brugmansia suaveolens mottle virus]